MATARLEIQITQNSQSAAGNYSIVSVYLYYYGNGGSWAHDNPPGTLTINGTTYNFRHNFETSTSAQLLYSVTNLTVPHNADGTKTLSCSATFTTGVSIGTLTTSASKALTTLDRTAPTVSIATTNITATSMTVSITSNVACNIFNLSTNNGSSYATVSTTNGTSATYTLTGLTPNTTYNLKAQARKTSNNVYGTSGTLAVTTVGATKINSVSAVVADAAEPKITLNLTSYNANYTHTLAISYDGATAVTITDITVSEGTADKTLTLTNEQRTALLGLLANNPSIEATYSLTSYSGNTQIGNPSTATGVIQTTPSESAPTFTGFAWQDTNSSTVALTDDNSIAIQGQSNLRVICDTATAKNGASIVSYSATIGTKTVSSSTRTVNFGAPLVSGSVNITATATDSRGYSASITKTITIIPYEEVAISQYSGERVNGVESYIHTILSGTYSPVTVNGSNKNSIERIQYRYKTTTATSWGTWTNLTGFTSSATEFSLNNSTGISLNASNSYNLEFRATDKLSTSNVVAVVVAPGKPLVSFRKEKIGINTNSPDGALHVVGDMLIQNGESAEAISHAFSDTFITEWATATGQTPPTLEGILTALGVDYVVERGISGTWYYRKWSSGRAELWGKFAQSVSAYSKGNFVIGSASVTKYPFSVTNPIAMATLKQVGTATGSISYDYERTDYWSGIASDNQTAQGTSQNITWYLYVNAFWK